MVRVPDPFMVMVARVPLGLHIIKDSSVTLVSLSYSPVVSRVVSGHP